MKWTAEQQNAIDARQGTVLVSAAAGSGKTAVLVERIIERITDKASPCNIDELLVVTFTRAAAAQMRERIAKKLAEKIAENPTDKNLLRQQSLLPFAKISTIDSFCIDLLRENFSLAGLSPDFGLMDDSETKLLKSQVAFDIIEELHEKSDEAFLTLNEYLVSSKNSDIKLSEMIIRLYDIAQSHPFPEKYLQSLLDSYTSGEDFKTEILSYVKSTLEYCLSRTQTAIEIAEKEPELNDKYLPTLLKDRQCFEFAVNDFDLNDWDKSAQIAKGISFGSLKSTTRGYDSAAKQQVTMIRNENKDLIKKMPECFFGDEASCDEDIKITRPVIEALIDAVNLFTERIDEVKRNTNKYYFSDLLHLAIALLTDGENKTQLAKDISSTLKEIMIDEYQDTNRAQDMLFSAISNNESNLFMVGDVKQSIYRFRQAMPEIFLERRNSMEKFTGENYPAKIFLDRNFRSRKGVIDSINFIFRQVMSDSVGEVDYNDDESLVYAASYDEKEGADTEILVIQDLRENEDDKAIDVEGRVIADKIHDIVGKLQINDGDTKRFAGYGDICILMRSVTDKGDRIARILAEEGIPAYSEKSNSLFEAFEVNVFFSLLEIIDNPIQDIPLTSVMLSPMFGFTTDDLSRIRIKDRRIPLYSCVLQSDDEKCKDFLRKIGHFRNLSVTLGIDAFLRRLLDETAYLTMLMSMKNGESRVANIRSIQALAKSFEQTSEGGFNSFVRYLEKIRDQADGSDKTPVKELKNAVRIMTIHKSKGLEFPVCILANCSKSFNTSSAKDNVLIHSKLGIGTVARDTRRLLQYETVSHKAVSLAIRKTDVSEEMRLLYVALTRAKEKLICTMTYSNPEKKLVEFATKVGKKQKIHEYAVEKESSFSSWILMSALRHPDTRKLRENLMIDLKELPCESKLSMEIIYPDYEESTENIEEGKNEKPDFNLVEKIREAAEYVYPYSVLSEVLAKISASELSNEYNYRDFFASSKPKFLNDGKLTGAERGTALHTFMQYADYEKAKTNPEEQGDLMVEDGLLTAQQLEAVDFDRVRNFFELGKRLSASEKVYREKRFIINLPIADVYGEIPDSAKDEKILVQGVIDCAFEENGEIVLLDYKTDRVKTEEELVSRYKEQLRMYKLALETVIGKKVSQVYLYSFSLDREIEIK